MNIKQDVETEVVALGKTFINKAIEQLVIKQYDECVSFIADAQKLFQAEKSPANVSICLSLTGLIEYLKDKNKYLRGLTYANDGKYLADCSGDISAKIISEFVFAYVDFAEENLDTAVLHYNNATKYAKIKDEFKLSKLIKEHLQQIQEKKMSHGKRDPLLALLRIGQTVAAETDISTLLKIIAEETKAAIQADRCSVFLFDKDKNELWSKVALGMDSQEIRFPADKGLAGHVVQTGEKINIKNAYIDKRFNKEIDLQTGYKTTTILCMPIKNLNQEIIGAFQVLN